MGKDKDEKKEKKEKKDKDEKKEKKEKKEKGEKKEKKDKDEKRDKKDKKDKDEKKDKKDRKDKEAKLEKKSSKSGRPESAKPKPQSARPVPRGPPPGRGPPQAKPAGGNDYLADFDLPSESDEEEERIAREEDDKPKHEFKMSMKEQKKLADKERRAAEAAYRQKKEALAQDDDRVFDVAYAGQDKASSLLDANALDVKVNDLTMRAKGKLLLDKTSVTIAYGRRYGLAGPNGHGKSTLLKMLAARRLPVPENMDVLLVEQEVEANETSAIDAVVKADVKLMALRAEEEELTAKMNDMSLCEADQEEATDRLNEVYEELRTHGGESAEGRAAKILHGLGFTPTMQKRSTQSFSGGWRMRISLARALYIQPTLLMLDEPTNHLDLRAVLWLEEYLCRYKKTLICVSHDREFLNVVTTDIIDLHDQQLHQYRGNFASFEEMKEQKRREANKAAEKFEKSLKAAKASANKTKAKDITAKAAKDTAKKARQQGNKKGGGEAMSSADVASGPKRWSDYTVSFAFPEVTELGGNHLLQLNDVSFKYPGRDDFGMSDLNIGVDMGSKVAIVGPNGAGKTTLMNLIAGDVQPTIGESRRPQKLRIGRYAQHFVDALNMEDTPIEYLLREHPDLGLTGQDMRAKLGRFGLSGHHHTQPICKLSGGQKARVVFTSIALYNPHILLLDEPTNHLDMQSIDALIEALTDFEGGIVVISHDGALLDALCEDEERSEVWIVDNGTVVKHHSDFEDYKESLINEIRADLDEDEDD